jgi:hypothetical protein
MKLTPRVSSGDRLRKILAAFTQNVHCYDNSRLQAGKNKEVAGPGRPPGSRISPIQAPAGSAWVLNPQTINCQSSPNISQFDPSYGNDLSNPSVHASWTELVNYGVDFSRRSAYEMSAVFRICSTGTAWNPGTDLLVVEC